MTRGRKDHEREQESSKSDHEAESNEEFDFGSDEEAEGGYMGRNIRQEPKSAEQGGDEAKKGEKANTKTWSDVVKGPKTKNTFAFRSGRIALIWKDREYSFRFEGFLSNLTKNVIPVSHVL